MRPHWVTFYELLYKQALSCNEKNKKWYKKLISKQKIIAK
jgi:hypothetical protein